MDPESAFLQRMRNGMDDAKPTGAQVLKALKYFDLGVKIEVTMVSHLVHLNYFSSFLVRNAIDVGEYLHVRIGAFCCGYGFLFEVDI